MARRQSVIELMASALAGETSLADETAPILTISVAAQLANMHPQTLRQYDRIGLVEPARTGGGGRRYSLRDVRQLREIQTLSQDEGINLAGIERIMSLEKQLDDTRRWAKQLSADHVKARQRNEALAHTVAHLRTLLRDLREHLQGRDRVFVAGLDGQAVPVSRGRRPARAAASSDEKNRATPLLLQAASYREKGSHGGSLVVWRGGSIF